MDSYIPESRNPVSLRANRGPDVVASGEFRFDFGDPSFVEALAAALLAHARQLRTAARPTQAARTFPRPTAAGAGRAERWLAAAIAASRDQKQLTRTQFIEKAREFGCSRRNAGKIWKRLVAENAVAAAWRTFGRPPKTRPEPF